MTDPFILVCLIVILICNIGSIVFSVLTARRNQ